MTLELLERVKNLQNDANNSSIKRSVKNGNILVTNVPFTPYPDGLGPDGESEYLSSDVVYKLSITFRYMLNNNISSFDFDDFELIN